MIPVSSSPQAGRGDNINPQFDLHRKVPAYITLDMQLSYEFMNAGKQLSATNAVEGARASMADGKGIPDPLFLGTNAGGNDDNRRRERRLIRIRLVLGAFNDSYDTSLYSIRNRFYYISLTKKF